MATQSSGAAPGASGREPGNHHPDGPLDVRTVVLLAVGGGAVYVAYRYPALGAALLVGVTVVLALHVLMKK